MSSFSARSQFSGFSGYSSDLFPDPFLDVATTAMPNSMRNALYWSEYIFSTHGAYRMAMERVISYFLTDIEFGDNDADDQAQEKWGVFLRETLDVFVNLQRAMRDRMCYGNSFVSLLVPFRRFLVCQGNRCGAVTPLRVVHDNAQYRFAWSDFKFHATCPKCGYRGPFRVDDKPDEMDKKLSLRHWSPHEIELLHDYFTDQVAYLWRIPEDYKAQIRRGNLYHLERAPVAVMEAIKRNQMFRFNPDTIYHMREPTLAGIRNRGWGIPRIISNFRQIYYVQVLRRYNEAIALDYVIPFRLLTPAARPGAGGGAGAGLSNTADPLMSFNVGGFTSQVNSMVRRRRFQPTNWNVLPFPVQYQQLGGDAKALAPVELITQGTEQLMNDAGAPIELFNGTLQLQTAAPALRLFEATWHHLVHDANMFLAWLEKQVSQLTAWDTVNTRLKRVTHADDISKQMAALQLYMGGQVSGSTALKGMGFDWRNEQRILANEAVFQTEQQAKVQERMEQAGFAAEIAKGGPGGAPAGPGGAPPSGGAPAGGAPPAGPMGAPGGAAGPVSRWLATMGPGTPIDPQSLMQVADSLAQELLGLPESVKDSELRMLKQRNQAVHALVRERMDQTRNQARMQGGAMLMSQQGMPR